MLRPHKKFDALKFKEEMQCRSEKRLSRYPPGERVRRQRESVENGPFGEWLKGIRVFREEASATRQRVRA